MYITITSLNFVVAIFNWLFVIVFVYFILLVNSGSLWQSGQYHLPLGMCFSFKQSVWNHSLEHFWLPQPIIPALLLEIFTAGSWSEFEAEKWLLPIAPYTEGLLEGHLPNNSGSMQFQRKCMLLRINACLLQFTIRIDTFSVSLGSWSFWRLSHTKIWIFDLTSKNPSLHLKVICMVLV